VIMGLSALIRFVLYTDAATMPAAYLSYLNRMFLRAHSALNMLGVRSSNSDHERFRSYRATAHRSCHVSIGGSTRSESPSGRLG
jgi:hypothetical protein